MSGDVTAVVSDTRRAQRALSEPHPVHRVPVARKIAHYLVGLLLIAGGIALMVSEGALREYEARLATQIAHATFAQDTMFVWSAGEPAIGFAVADSWYVARVTVQCAIALYLGPIAMLAGLMAFSVRLRLNRILLAAVIGLTGMVLLNQVRLVAICFAWGTWGRDGFHWFHGPVGTAVMLLGIAGVLITFFLVVVRGQRTVAVARPAKETAPDVAVDKL
ncbi:exosortase R [Microbacterium sp. TPU 3598]|uniref:exosortase R n=1 Tax=Microbacterium sp. TPU 3598 TaxID=1938334 RepID=UPI000BBAD5CF|nr:exosortase R [Microbacterium sp. TPU 3598]